MHGVSNAVTDGAKPDTEPPAGATQKKVAVRALKVLLDQIVLRALDPNLGTASIQTIISSSSIARVPVAQLRPFSQVGANQLLCDVQSHAILCKPNKRSNNTTAASPWPLSQRRRAASLRGPAWPPFLSDILAIQYREDTAGFSEIAPAKAGTAEYGEMIRLHGKDFL